MQDQDTTPAPMSATDYVCWSPSEAEPPTRVLAVSDIEAAKLHVMRAQSSATRHSNEWSAAHVLVVDYHTGETTWIHVKVTVSTS